MWKEKDTDGKTLNFEVVYLTLYKTTIFHGWNIRIRDCERTLSFSSFVSCAKTAVSSVFVFILIFIFIMGFFKALQKTNPRDVIFINVV